MSYKYDEYLYDHVSGVRKAYDWLVMHDIIPSDIAVIVDGHDFSKRCPEEYDAYDKYFYGGFIIFIVTLIIGSIGFFSMMTSLKKRLRCQRILCTR